MKKMDRNRILYVALVILTMALGILSRKVPGLPDFIGLYAGDTLWALMVFLGIAFLFKKLPTRYVVLMALVFAFGIEGSQLYHAPWIDALRATTLGGLVLGYGFLWSDLVCYTIGILLGGILDYLLNFKKSRKGFRLFL